jgi:hypothetical protein
VHFTNCFESKGDSILARPARPTNAIAALFGSLNLPGGSKRRYDQKYSMSFCIGASISKKMTVLWQIFIKLKDSFF